MTAPVGDKGIIIKNEGDYRWNGGYTHTVGEAIVAYPTEIGDYVALPIITPVIGDVVDPGTGVASPVNRYAYTFDQ